MKKIWGICTIVSVCFVLSMWLYPNSKQTSTTSQFTIASKVEENQALWIQGYNPEEDQTRESKILVRDRNTWNEMRENKTYTITYMQQGNQEPVFVEFVSRQ